ncbi:MAG: PIG-L family deacetylase [Acidobacteria bacterium]|nr:PIG-L family deacetylase [Acidobacteriota bacterium]
MTGPLRTAAARPSVLAVFAHPDDESLACGGLLAWCHALGIRTSLLCLTHGEHGGQPPTQALATTRASELRAAAAALGIDEVALLSHEDGMLPWIDAALLERDILDAIARTAADVVITFDEDGLYWHPDHVAVHARTTAAVVSAPEPRPTLYYVTIPNGAMRAVLDESRARALTQHEPSPPPTHILGIANPDAFGAHAPAPTLVLDTGDFARQKLMALHCHRSQLGTRDALPLMTSDTAPALLAIEQYRRAAVGAATDTFLERLAGRADRHRAPESPPTRD